MSIGMSVPGDVWFVRSCTHNSTGVTSSYCTNDSTITCKKAILLLNGYCFKNMPPVSVWIDELFFKPDPFMIDERNDALG